MSDTRTRPSSPPAPRKAEPAVNPAAYESLTAQADLAFPEYTAPPDQPMVLVHRWLATAVERKVREPKALALATADGKGRPSTRVVALSAVEDAGLVFATHSGSQKGRELAVNPWASGVLYWRETGQQIIFGGEAVQLEDSEADRYWNARPLPLHPMSAVSHQSDVLEDRAAMLAAAARLAALGTPLPRPERFVVFRLEPSAVEFWSVSADRLHMRLRYDRDDHGWHTSRLQP
jgi:pyridoxamine-phosphate oxidase